MPNYVYNTVTFKREDAKKVYRLVHTEDNAFDFNAIIPMPETLNIASGSSTYDAEEFLKCGVTDDLKSRYPDEGEAPDPSYFYTQQSIWGSPSPKTLPELRVYAELVKGNKEKYGHASWYSWSCAEWGTKWNACDADWVSDTCVHFQTAWSDPEPVFLELASKLGITFMVDCEEESLAFCSVCTYSPDGVDRVDEEGYKGLVLLGNDREDILSRYEEWCDEDEMQEIRDKLDELGIF